MQLFKSQKSFNNETPQTIRRMTADELKSRFPNASKGFLSSNTWTVAKLESNTCYAPLAAKEVQGSSRQRFLVRVESTRRRLLDTDNLCEKYLLDLCRYAGAIPGDSPAEIELETRQRKAGKGEAESTLITITPL
jgi:hypothetical protein